MNMRRDTESFFQRELNNVSPRYMTLNWDCFSRQCWYFFYAFPFFFFYIYTHNILRERYPSCICANAVWLRSVICLLISKLCGVFKCARSWILSQILLISVCPPFFFFLLYRQPHFLRAMWQFSTSHHSVVAAIWQIITTSFLSGYLIRLLFLCIMVIDGHRRG